MNRKMISIHVCGDETVSRRPGVPLYEFLRFDFQQGGGLEVVRNASDLLTVDHPECPIVTYQTELRNPGLMNCQGTLNTDTSRIIEI